MYWQLIDEISSDVQQGERETPMFDMGPVRCPPVTSEGLVDMVGSRNVSVCSFLNVFALGCL